MKQEGLQLTLAETKALVSALGQFKAADVFDLLVKIKAHEQILQLQADKLKN